MRHPDAKGKPVAAIDICVDNLQVVLQTEINAFRTLMVGIHREHHKLISAKTGNKVQLAMKNLLEYLRRFCQGTVPFGVAKGVVDLLEAVQIEKDK